MSVDTIQQRSIWAWTSFALGAAAVVSALFVFWGGPFAPQQTTGVSLGELAAEIGKSALRSMAGSEQPAPIQQIRDLDDYLQIGVSMLGGFAIVFGSFAIVRRESLRPAVAGVLLGGAAVILQFFLWAFVALLGVLLIIAIVHSLSDTFSSVFGG